MRPSLHSYNCQPKTCLPLLPPTFLWSHRQHNWDITGNLWLLSRSNNCFSYVQDRKFNGFFLKAAFPFFGPIENKNNKCAWIMVSHFIFDVILCLE